MADVPDIDPVPAEGPPPQAAPASPAAEPAKALVAAKLSDFSDRLSPMLVKELRQGLRARTFVIVFLTLQALLGLVLLAATGAAAAGRAGQVISGIIFAFFSVAVMVIQPLRGISAVHSEIKANTLDLMVLTRLDAWRIVLGKWVAIVSQSALLLTAIVPYLILRYWFGDMNLLGEMVLLVLVFLGSCVATSVTVGLSAVSSIIIRGLLPLFGGIVLAWCCLALSFSRYEFEQIVEVCSMQDSRDAWGIAMLVLVGAYAAWSLLSLAASMIAPLAENHATPRRLVTLAALLLAILAAIGLDLDEEIVVFLAFLLVIPPVIMALTEPFFLLPTVTRPFVRKGALGVVAGRFLYPGWPAGVLFSLLALALAGILMGTGLPENVFSDEDFITVVAAVAASLLFPAVVILPFEKRLRSRFTGYLLVLVASLILAIVLTLVGEAVDHTEPAFLWAFIWIPMVNLFMTAMSGYPDEVLATVATVFLILYASLLLVAALSRFPTIRRTEREEETPQAPPSADPGES